MIRVNGGTKLHKEMTTKVAKWVLKHYGLKNTILFIQLRPYEDCWGYCVEGRTEHSYRIMVAHDQSVRDFVATLVHELIHVKQWETGKWTGNGEKECERLQYKLTDKIWKKGIL